MAKWIQAGYLPAMPLSPKDETPVEDRQELMLMIEDYLLTMFREEIDREMSEEENLEAITETAETFLNELKGNGLAMWSSPREIAMEVLGKESGAISNMLEDEALQEKIMMWLTAKDETFPLNPKTEEEVEDYIRSDPVSWAETIAQNW